MVKIGLYEYSEYVCEWGRCINGIKICLKQQQWYISLEVRFVIDNSLQVKSVHKTVNLSVCSPLQSSPSDEVAA